MSPNLKFWEWGKTKIDPQQTEFGQSLAYAETAKTASDIEREHDLGINLDLIKDHFVLESTEDRCYIAVPMRDEDGKFVFVDGKLQVTKQINHGELAKRKYLSPLHSVRFRTEKQAELAKILAQVGLETAKIYDQDSPYYLQKSSEYLADRLLIEGSIDDSVRGRKAQLLKRTTKSTSVEVSQNTKKTNEEYM